MLMGWLIILSPNNRSCETQNPKKHVETVKVVFQFESWSSSGWYKFFKLITAGIASSINSNRNSTCKRKVGRRLYPFRVGMISMGKKNRAKYNIRYKVTTSIQTFLTCYTFKISTEIMCGSWISGIKRWGFGVDEQRMLWGKFFKVWWNQDILKKCLCASVGLCFSLNPSLL